MLYDRKIYESELPHRAVAVYLYLKDRADKEGTCYPAMAHRKGTAPFCQYGQESHSRSGK